MAGRDLIDTRKRKRSKVRDERPDIYHPSDGSSTPKVKRIDLGALLRPERLSKTKYDTIQGVLIGQEQAIAARGAEIKDRCTEIHKLKDQADRYRSEIEIFRHALEKKNTRNAELEGQATTSRQAASDSARELQERKEYYQNRISEQDVTLELGTKLFKGKCQQAEDFAKVNRQLCTTVSERDATILALKGQLWRISSTTGNEQVAAAVDAQAQQTLGMVKGLQNDVAKRDEIIKSLSARIEELAAADHDSRTKLHTMTETLAAKSTALEAAESRATALQSIAEEQALLIKDLMK